MEYTKLRDERPQPPREFTLFNKLPAELRVQVWEHSLADVTSLRPAIIRQSMEIPFRHTTRYKSPNSPDVTLQLHLATERPPALLHVNRESRYEALKQFISRTIELRDVPLIILFFNRGAETLLLDVGPPPPGTEWKRVLHYCCFTTSYKRNNTATSRCDHTCVMSRQFHLLKCLQGADTSSITNIALRTEVFAPFPASRCPRLMNEALQDVFPQLASLTFIIA